jgi:signal transduction histidine kinase
MSAVRKLLLAVVIGGLYAAGAQLTFWYFNAPEAGAAFFPPAGLTLAVLLMTPRRTWWLWLVAVAIAEFSVDLAHDQTVFMALGFALANVAQPVVGATLARKGTRRYGDAPRSYLWVYVATAVVIGPLVGAIVGGIVASAAGTGSFPSTPLKWWLGDAIGVLVVATPLLAWTRRRVYPVKAGLPEIAAWACVALAVTLLPAIFMHESFAYAVLPVMMLAALRGGPLAVGVSGFAVGMSASWVVATGRADALLRVQNTDNALIDTQLFIAVTVLSALVLAVEVTERTNAERVSRRAETQRAKAELAAMQAAATERQRIARETHDIVGHALNVIILSGAAARRVMHRDDEKAKELLATIESVGRDAFRDLDVALGLTDQSPDFTPLKGLADLDELVGRLVQAGMAVDYVVEGSPRPLPRLVDGSAYRIIQESLTNVAKHSADAHTRVHVRYAPTTLVLEVIDDGAGAAIRNGRSRRGLIGMRERVAVLGGHIKAGPAEEGGFSVVAELPIDQS